MNSLIKVTKDNFTYGIKEPYPVYADSFNSNMATIETAVASLESSVSSAQSAVDALEAFNSTTTVSNIYTAEVTLTATQIVGTDAGDIGHANGAVIVAAPSSDYALEFVSAVLIYDYATAAYTGGNNDMVFRVGDQAASTAITDTNCIKATGDKVFRLGAIATEKSLPVGSTINLFGTAFTNPGTAAGVLRVQVNYRIHKTSL